MNKTLTAPNCLIYIIQQTCFKPHYFNSLIQFYCIHKQVTAKCESDSDIVKLKSKPLRKDRKTKLFTNSDNGYSN